MRYVLILLTFLTFSCKNETNTEVGLVSKNNAVKIDLEIVDFNGLEKYLNTTTDITYVVNFWATWCAPCVKELPYFDTLNKIYAIKNVKVLLVSLDFPHLYETKLKPFIIDRKITSKVVVLNDKDSNLWIPKVHEDWSGAIPATLIFNKDARKFFEKTFTYKELENELNQFLK